MRTFWRIVALLIIIALAILRCFWVPDLGLPAMNVFALAGLVQLAGDIEAAHEALRRMILDLENLDATIQQFDPTYQVEPLQGESNAIPIYTDTRNSKP